MPPENILKIIHFWKILFTISNYTQIFNSLYQVNVLSKILRELGFVHYNEKFTITRYTITRVGCTIFCEIIFYKLQCPISVYYSVMQLIIDYASIFTLDVQKRRFWRRSVDQSIGHNQKVTILYINVINSGLWPSFWWWTDRRIVSRFVVYEYLIYVSHIQIFQILYLNNSMTPHLVTKKLTD